MVNSGWVFSVLWTIVGIPQETIFNPFNFSQKPTSPFAPWNTTEWPLDGLTHLKSLKWIQLVSNTNSHWNFLILNKIKFHPRISFSSHKHKTWEGNFPRRWWIIDSHTQAPGKEFSKGDPLKMHEHRKSN